MLRCGAGFGQVHSHEQARLIHQALDLHFGGLHTIVGMEEAEEEANS